MQLMILAETVTAPSPPFNQVTYGWVGMYVEGSFTVDLFLSHFFISDDYHGSYQIPKYMITATYFGFYIATN